MNESLVGMDEEAHPGEHCMSSIWDWIISRVGYSRKLVKSIWDWIISRVGFPRKLMSSIWDWIISRVGFPRKLLKCLSKHMGIQKEEGNEWNQPNETWKGWQHCTAEGLQNFCTLPKNPYLEYEYEGFINLKDKQKINFEKYSQLAKYAQTADHSSQSKPGEKDEYVAKENKRMKPEPSVTCIWCEDKRVVLAFKPCLHLVCCEDCAPAMKHCPVCKKYIKDMFPAYLVN